FTQSAEIPWPDFTLVTLVQHGPGDCQLWKAVAKDAGNLTHWRGAKSRGWLHIGDRSWGLGYGITDMAQHAPASLAADLDTGDLSAALRLRFWPSQAHRLDPRAVDGEQLTRPHEFFFAPGSERWDDAMAERLDQFGAPSERLSSAEPDAADVKFARPGDLAPTPTEGECALFRVDEPAGVNRRAWPISVGVPLRQGDAASVHELCLANSEGNRLPCQLEPLAYWPDKSVKWVLVDAQVDLPAGLGAVLALKKGLSPQPVTHITTAETASGVRVDTGVFAFEVDRSGSGFIDRAWLGSGRNARMVVTDGGGRRSVLDFVRSDCYDTGDHDIRGTRDESEVRVEEVKIERSGPLRAVVLIRGKYCNRVESPFTLRLEAYAGKPWVRVQHTFTYAMDAQAEFVKAAGVCLPIVTDGGHMVTFAGPEPISLSRGSRQGGLLQESLNRAIVWECEEPGHPVKALQQFERCSGWGDISSDEWGLTVAVQNFWQEFPKAITVGADGAGLDVWFWPAEAPPLDLRRYSPWMYPQVGETVHPWPYRGDARNVGYAAGLAKTSTVVFAFHTRPFGAGEAEALARSFQDRPVAICNPAHYAEAGVAGCFQSYDDDYPEIERTLTDICDWFIFNRERFSWYGMIDYGDIGHTWRPPVRLTDDGPYVLRDGWAYDIGRWGWTNTEGQDALGYLTCFFHTGYRPYFHAGAIAARHNQDIDIFHWGPYKYHGHTRHNVNHWGDGDFEIRISQPSSNRFYYYLTGDLRSRDIIEGVVDECYLEQTVTQSADLGAVLYGFMVRWEMTGDPIWRDRALGMCHAYRDCIFPSGQLPHRGFAIEASTGRLLAKPQPPQDEHGLMFLHGFGAIHAMVELEQLTGDPQLWDMIYRHAGYCADLDPTVNAYFLILAHALERTGERRFADRLLTNLARRGITRGIYPRDRAYWTGTWEQPEARPGERPIVRSVNTAGAGFDWSPIPVLLRALAARAIQETEIPQT
ncbi:MAG: hypothetical protein ABSD48_03715, partial [Armatimonadota bacterium]